MIKRLTIFTALLIILTACSVLKPKSSQNDPNPDPANFTSTPVITDTAVPVEPTETPQPSETAVPETPETPSAYGPTDFPVHVNPLTGKPVSDPQMLERRPVAVKVQMFPRGGRPPWGVSLADVVFDYYQNFGLTRFHAIFYSQDAQMVGPIRSARLLDIDLINMYKSIFAFGSAESRTISRLFNQEFAPRLILEGQSTCPPMCRVDPNQLNHLVTNTRELTDYSIQRGVDNARQNLDGMRFDPVIPPGGLAGQQLTVRHSISAYARWEFDPAAGRFIRFQDTQEASDMTSEAYEPLFDRLTNQQIAADNVVVLVAAHRYTFNTRPGPNEVIEIGLEGVGPAYAFRDGQVFQVNWNRSAKDSVIYLSFPDGTLYPFKPGVTWFEIVGKTAQVTTEGAAWRFNHLIP